MDWLFWKYYQRARKGRGIIQYTTQHSLRQPFTASYIHHTCERKTRPTIPAICKRNFFSRSRWLFIPYRGILCINQRQKLLNNWRGVLINRRFFSDQTSRRLLSSFTQLGREYSVYLIPCLSDAIDHSRNLLAATNRCYRNVHEKLRSVLWLYESNLYVTSAANQSTIHRLTTSQSDAVM